MTQPTTRPDGSQEWSLDGQLHRLDGPAITRPDGYEAWYCHGERHRLYGPAIVDPNGFRAWWQHGGYHRLDGPAVIFADGSEMWWINGHDITSKVEAWIASNGLPDWKLWDDETKILFRIWFS